MIIGLSNDNNKYINIIFMNFTKLIKCYQSYSLEIVKFSSDFCLNLFDSTSKKYFNHYSLIIIEIVFVFSSWHCARNNCEQPTIRFPT